jgi:hypothetical protein
MHFGVNPRTVLIERNRRKMYFTATGLKVFRNGKMYYTYPHKRKLPPAPTITAEMVAYSYKFGIQQTADLCKVSTYHITKARNELHARRTS